MCCRFSIKKCIILIDFRQKMTNFHLQNAPLPRRVRPMPFLRLPAFEPNTPNATLVRQLVAEGATVDAGQPLALFEGEVSRAELNAAGPGRLARWLVAVGGTIATGDPFADFLPAGSQPSPAPAPKPQESPAVSSTSATAAVPILMPQAGNSMEEGTIIAWRVKEGDTIRKGQVLFELETDKATIEVEAEDEGLLAQIVVGDGGTAPVRTPVAFLGAPGAPGAAPVAAAPAAAAAAPVAAEPAAMPAGVVPILMPQAGNSMEEGTILNWRVAVGDAIKPGQVLFELETDKATIEVEAEHGGRLARILVPAGSSAPIKTPVALLADDDAAAAAWNPGAAVDAKPAAPAPTAKPATPAPAPVAARPAGERPKASPAARRLARERGVDLASLPAGSGPGGRLLSTDIPASAPAAAAPRPAVANAGPAVRRPLSKMRRAIARNLVAAKQTIPHFYMALKIDAGPLAAFVAEEKKRYKLSINDAIVLAVARTLQAFPAFRSQLDGDEIVEHPNSNIGIAVGTDNGLVVPVVQRVEGMSLQQLAGEARRVVEAARAGRLEGVGTGVFTISNLGMFGIGEFTAIINPPESGILAVGSIVEEVIVRDGAMRPGRTMTLSLSADHRVVDGMVAAQFLAHLRGLLENPATGLS